MSEVPLYAINNPDGQELNVRRRGQGPECQRLQRSTRVASPIIKRPPPKDPRRTLGMVLRYRPRERCAFL